MRVLITGGQGQLGKELSQTLSTMQSPLGIVPPAYRGAHVDSPSHHELDISQAPSVNAWFAAHSPYDLIVNCAAQTNVDRCEQHEAEAFAINATGARNIAQAAQDSGSILVHVSTDYVFSGHGLQDYLETDEINPSSAYGRTKAAGERYVADTCTRAFVVRTSWLYGRFGKNFVETMLRLGANHDTVTVVNDQYGNPTNASDLSFQILNLAVTEKFGIYHASGRGTCSWFDFACAIMEHARPSCQVIPCSSAEYAAAHPQAAPRPLHSALDCTRIEQATGACARLWQDALITYLDERLQRERFLSDNRF